MNREIKLSELEALVFDCQASGANPSIHDLLETAWLHFDPVENSDRIPESYVITRNPEQEPLPNQVLRVTGLQETDFANGISREQVWKKLLIVATEISESHPSLTCPVIIHYARFERPHLKHLHTLFSKTDAFPFTLICTHEIARRLFAHLPRKSLRAVAGYLGYSTGEKRRSASHVKATAFIWRRMLPLLESGPGVTSFSELREWLDSETQTVRWCKQYPMPDTERKALPSLPGIYKMRRTNHDVLYVGKATSLKQRVNSYFHKSSGHSEHTLEMLSQATAIEHTVTPTSLEAALLENEEIKRLAPPYNIALQRGDRQVCFFSRDLSAWSTTFDHEFTVGPVLSRDSVCAIRYIYDYFDKTKTKKSKVPNLHHLLAISESYAPEAECILEGLKQFYENLAIHGKEKLSIQTLLTIGRKVWLEHMYAAQESIQANGIDGDELQEEEVEDESSWTPDKVERRLGSVLSHGAFQIRRGRFLQLLHESTLSWQSKNDPEVWHSIAVKNAEILSETDASYIDMFSADNRVVRDRDNCELLKYDRMRILLTEIRRLVNEDRAVKVRFGDRAVLNTAALKKVFLWL